jgi:hypothetical protein
MVSGDIAQVDTTASGIFDTKRPDTPTVEKKIAGIEGKPRYYAVKADALPVRSSE